MLIPVLLFIVGLLCLIKGGDWFVDGATGIARRFHVPELLIGATVSPARWAAEWGVCARCAGP